MYENMASTSKEEARPVQVDRRTKAEIAFDKLKEKKVMHTLSFRLYE